MHGENRSAHVYDIHAVLGKELGYGSAPSLIDLSQLPSGDWPMVIDAFNRGTPLPDTTEFNFQTGLV